MRELQDAVVTYYDHAGIIHLGVTLCPEVKGGTGHAMTIRQALIATSNRDGKLCSSCVLF